MSDENSGPGLDLGVFARPTDTAPRFGIGDIVAAAFCVVWLLGALVLYLIFGRGDTPSAVLGWAGGLAIVILPVVLVWIAARAARAIAQAQEDIARAHAAIAALRQGHVQAQQGTFPTPGRSLEKRIEDIASAQRRLEAALGGRTPAPAPAAAAAPAQPAPMADAPPPPGQPLAASDFIRALNFPETAEDREGFRALRLALADRRASQLVQASQDVLTLLSQDGIYVDDMQPDRASPGIWRRFAHGERGQPIAALGGWHDPETLGPAIARLRQDAIFRDTVHHFLRKFDHIFIEFEKTASDQEIAELADTRTARAFMLLGRVSGTFD